MIHLKRTHSENEDFKNLTQQLDSDLNGRYGELQTQYDAYNKIEQIHTVVVAYSRDTPVGCGCFKAYSNTAVEIKRMFVKPSFRGKGIATLILTELERWASEMNYSHTTLETGIKQFEAISFYNRLGYKRIANYGQYIGNENSVCMEKIIVFGV